MKRLALFATATIALAVSAAPASAQTLLHEYKFDGTTVADSVGSVDGALFNGATVSGGVLHLDGVDDHADLTAQLIPTNGDPYSVFISFTTFGPQAHSYNELLSQGSSGGPGFYLGATGGLIRLTDYFGGGLPGTAFPDSGSHNLLLTTATGLGTFLYLDGVQVFNTPGYLGIGATGNNTRFGDQFGSYGENFKADVDLARFYSGVASYAQASAIGAVPEPATWAMMILGFGIAGAAMRRRRNPALALG